MHEEPMRVSWSGSSGTAGTSVENQRELAAGGRSGILAVSAVPRRGPQMPNPCLRLGQERKGAG